MKVSFIKYKNDSKSYKMAKGLGMDVFEIDSPELIDKKIEELEKDEYTTIFCITLELLEKLYLVHKF